MMHNTTTKDGRRLTGYNNNTNYQSQQRHSLYDDDMEDQHNHYYDDDYVDDSDEHDEDDEEDDAGSILSIPDPNINFDLVYALHTFAATVDGQASVVKGDALTLLDDSNSYWWLVKVLKTSEVGYIPAENIETPYERLARLNSHRNIELTRRDIQDAFPAPPSTKAKATKRVTLAKGVKFQAQVIFGGSDDEDDFAEEYEEWNEALLSSDSDGSSSDSDDYDYYSSSLSGNGYNSNSNNNQVGFSKAAHVPPIVTQSLDRRTSEQHSIDSPLSARSNRLGSRDTLDLEQSETIKISLTPSIARGGGDVDNNQGYNQYQQQQKKSTMNKLERLLGEDDSLTSPTSPKSSGGIGKKSSIRKFFSRGSKDSNSSSGSGKRKDSASKISISGGDSILSETNSISSQSTSYSERDRSGSLDSAMLLQAYGASPSSDGNDYHQQHATNNMVTPINTDSNRYYGPNSSDKFNTCTSPSSITSPSSFTSQSMSSFSQPHPYQQSQQHQYQNQQEQPTTLMIHGGNIVFDDKAKPAMVYTSTTAIELIQQVVETFDFGPKETITDRAANYYLVVKGADDDEYILLPSDQPLSIYHSLTGHLNTPMPSLKKARRISQLMSTASDGTAHMGGPSHHTASSELSNHSAVRFYLHSKKRTVHEEGVIRIKVSLLQSEIVDQEGLFGPGQTRVDKSLYVPHTGSVGDVAALILERFHVLNGVVDGSADLDAQIKALRLDSRDSQVQAVLYKLNFFRNGQEFALDVNDPITKAYDGETMPPIHHSRGSNPDRSSIASMSSVIHSPQAEDTFFVLRRLHPARQVDSSLSQESGNQVQEPSSKPPPRPARSHRPPVRQNTPMPNTKPFDDPSPVPSMHPLAMYNTEPNETRSTSPTDMISSSSPLQITNQHQHPSSSHHASSPMMENHQYYADAEKEQVTPEEDGDVLTKLDEALDSLANTRNSNEPLTEAITHHQQQQQQQQQRITPPPTTHSPFDRQSSPSSTASSNEHVGLRSQMMRDLPSAGSTASTTATSISTAPRTPEQQLQQQQDDDEVYDKAQKPTRARRGSIQSMLYWDDFGMDELMIMIRGSAKYQETMEKKEMDKKNRRSSRHYTPSIRNEINEVFKDSHSQLEQLEKELDTLMTQAVITYG
ncbi:hypothetical protein BCR42DRAFT_151307 [Absidia repens]|uniref:SH3 domain-containing protein n=1 Tax=Absidia repens TaxID=90262 RepID=A0A1X2I220_9FUNG|nr:hypothetical protein BCR42DRAFT_151307 [Absidia repens]